MADWIVLVIRVPTEPARHRVAIWRELRRAGAVVLGPAVWALPDVSATQPVLARVEELVARAEGGLVRLRGTGYADADAAQLAALYEGARREEWAEFVADCDKYLAELEREHARQKYTLAELEEEDQSLERLRRWYRDIRSRDLVGTADAQTADAQTDAQTADAQTADRKLKECATSFDEYAEAVYRALGQPGGS